jgi:hypothetical protein
MIFVTYSDCDELGQFIAERVSIPFHRCGKIVEVTDLKDDREAETTGT